MSAYLTALAGAMTAAGVGAVAMGRSWPGTTGRHRATRVRAVLDEVSLSELLDGGEIEANDFDHCPAEDRTTFHAIRSNGSRRCWTCNCESPAGAQ